MIYVKSQQTLYASEKRMGMCVMYFRVLGTVSSTVYWRSAVVVWRLCEARKLVDGDEPCTRREAQDLCYTADPARITCARTPDRRIR
eukprot:COSAG01_NODE_9779_length_2346_cov_2.823320_2_plen_87_part_00